MELTAHLGTLTAIVTWRSALGARIDVMEARVGARIDRLESQR